MEEFRRLRSNSESPKSSHVMSTRRGINRAVSTSPPKKQSSRKQQKIFSNEENSTSDKAMPSRISHRLRSPLEQTSSSEKGSSLSKTPSPEKIKSGRPPLSQDVSSPGKTPSPKQECNKGLGRLFEETSSEKISSPCRTPPSEKEFKRGRGRSCKKTSSSEKNSSPPKTPSLEMKIDCRLESPSEETSPSQEISSPCTTPSSGKEFHRGRGRPPKKTSSSQEILSPCTTPPSEKEFHRGRGRPHKKPYSSDTDSSPTKTSPAEKIFSPGQGRQTRATSSTQQALSLPKTPPTPDKSSPSKKVTPERHLQKTVLNDEVKTSVESIASKEDKICNKNVSQEIKQISEAVSQSLEDNNLGPPASTQKRCSKNATEKTELSEMNVADFGENVEAKSRLADRNESSQAGPNVPEVFVHQITGAMDPFKDDHTIECSTYNESELEGTHLFIAGCTYLVDTLTDESEKSTSTENNIISGSSISNGSKTYGVISPKAKSSSDSEIISSPLQNGSSDAEFGVNSPNPENLSSISAEHNYSQNTIQTEWKGVASIEDSSPSNSQERTFSSVQSPNPDSQHTDKTITENSPLVREPRLCSEDPDEQQNVELSTEMRVNDKLSPNQSSSLPHIGDLHISSPVSSGRTTQTERSPSHTDNQDKLENSQNKTGVQQGKEPVNEIEKEEYFRNSPNIGDLHISSPVSSGRTTQTERSPSQTDIQDKLKNSQNETGVQQGKEPVNEIEKEESFRNSPAVKGKDEQSEEFLVKSLSMANTSLGTVISNSQEKGSDTPDIPSTSKTGGSSSQEECLETSKSSETENQPGEHSVDIEILQDSNQNKVNHHEDLPIEDIESAMNDIFGFIEIDTGPSKDDIPTIREDAEKSLHSSPNKETSPWRRHDTNLQKVKESASQGANSSKNKKKGNNVGTSSGESSASGEIETSPTKAKPTGFGLPAYEVIDLDSSSDSLAKSPLKKNSPAKRKVSIMDADTRRSKRRKKNSGGAVAFNENSETPPLSQIFSDKSSISDVDEQSIHSADTVIVSPIITKETTPHIDLLKVLEDESSDDETSSLCPASAPCTAEPQPQNVPGVAVCPDETVMGIDSYSNIIFKPVVKEVILLGLTPNLEALILEDSSNLLKGFCGWRCLRLMNFDEQFWKSESGIFRPYCKTCKDAGIENPTTIDFWFVGKFRVLTEENTFEVVFSSDYGGKFLDCTKEEYVSDKITRDRVHNRLLRLIEECTPLELTYFKVKNQSDREHFRAV